MDTTSSTNRNFKKMVGNILSIFVILTMAFSATGISHAASKSGLVPAGSSLKGTARAALIAAAQHEGSLTVIGLPDDWCNYGSLIQGFETTYGITVNSVAPFVSSEEVLQAVRNGSVNPGPNTPDVIDVGPSFAVQAKAEGLLAPYKVATWNTIPNFMKDGDGYWYGDYYGVMAIAANTTQYAAPTSWNDVLVGDNIGPVALGGTPTVSNMGFFAVYAAALANGGSLDNVEPGVQFFKNLNSAGRLLSTIGNGSTLASGATPVLLEWSYLALVQRDAYPAAQIEVVVPGPHPIASYYAQAVSAYAPHPNAARLWMEYLYSDQGQLAWLEGYCFPARFNHLLARDVIPQDLLDRLPDISGTLFPSLDQIADAKAFVDANWACTVYAECQSFEDVSSAYWAWNFIERLYKAGITGGCGTNPLTYCPEGTVTRAQMAVFLERGIHGSTYNPPAAGGSTGFGDVPPTYWAAAWIKQLATEGITGGCGAGIYCPEAPVTRAQMAVFLLRSKYGASYNPPAVGSSTGFTDVPPTYWAASWIKQLVAEGITSGCGAGTYCPEAPVTRAQMAVFLVRTFGLP